MNVDDVNNKIIKSLEEKIKLLEEKIDCLNLVISFKDDDIKSLLLKYELETRSKEIMKEMKSKAPNHIMGGVDFSESINQLNNL